MNPDKDLIMRSMIEVVVAALTDTIEDGEVRKATPEEQLKELWGVIQNTRDILASAIDPNWILDQMREQTTPETEMVDEYC